MIIDVLLVTYNQEKFVRKALESVRMQVVDDSTQVRVFIADDCSTDDTISIIKEFESEIAFPFVYLDKAENVGIAKNYSSSIKFCTGDFIAILEGDDYWTDKYRLQKHVQYLITHPDCVLSVNGRMDYDEALSSYQCSREDNDYFCFSLDDAIVNYDFIRNLSTTVFRAQELRSVNPALFDRAEELGSICVDQFLVYDVLQRGYGYHFKDVMSVYRINTGQNFSYSLQLESMSSTIDWWRKKCTIANSLLKESHESSFNKVLDFQTSLIKDYYQFSQVQKLSRFLPPIIVRLYFAIPKLWLFIKKIVFAFVPTCIRGFLKEYKRRKTSNVY